jgi:hypothetical protein
VVSDHLRTAPRSGRISGAFVNPPMAATNRIMRMSDFASCNQRRTQPVEMLGRNSELEVTMRMARVAAALSLAGAISLTAIPVQAAPLTSLSAAAKPAADAGHAIPVRWGGWHGGWGGWHGGGFGFGIGALAAGALIGAAIASPYYYSDVGYPYYGYGYPYGWGYSTAYYPAYSYGYYRTYPRVAYGYRYYRPYRHVYVAHRPFWRHSYAMVRVHRHHRHWR